MYRALAFQGLAGGMNRRIRELVFQAVNDIRSHLPYPLETCHVIQPIIILVQHTTLAPQELRFGARYPLLRWPMWVP
jgi:hypothetical protein